MSGFLMVFLQVLVTVLWLMIVARVLLSWINPTMDGPVGRFLFDTTEPLLAPIRRVLPQSATMDLSPLVLMLGLGFVMQLVVFR
ncbi:MAG: YggT family protein [Chloroflexota bacterium]|jgi:YggT family protein|nr:YggT family protein [Chloroflexota bacterium]